MGVIFTSVPFRRIGIVQHIVAYGSRWASRRSVGDNTKVPLKVENSPTPDEGEPTTLTEARVLSRAGEVIGNIKARKGSVEAIDNKGKIAMIKAHPPLTRMFGYSTDLRSMTQGRGTFSMRFSRYDKVVQ